MNRVMLALSIVFALIYNAYAVNVYLDVPQLSYGSFGKADSMLGYGTGVGVSVTPEVSVYAKFFMTSGTKLNSEEVKIKETETKNIYALAEYSYSLGFVPVAITGSGGIGMSDVGIRDKVESTAGNWTWSEKKEKGVYCALFGGARFFLTQYISCFANIGYQKVTAFQDDLRNVNISGYQLTAGFTITVWGVNAAVDEDY